MIFDLLLEDYKHIMTTSNS